ncbi:phage head-tail joining protein [Lysobacter enzymogenes]|uniref:phage head closure protein n=1 Tax=Lysobacter enzymogenes TaxID=69 RepID=UPI0019D1ACCE|nr:phage head closure protein [Lysobacter enzymogenes]MBN7138997.1 phage head-tail joining protein [Lysobacter enzymogenes]
MGAGKYNRRATVKYRVDANDDAGQPADDWKVLGSLWVSIANETGMGAIRSSLQGNVPASIARYSFEARFESVRELGVNEGMRMEHDGLIFDIKGVVRDLKHRGKAYILTEQGGNAG